MEYRQPFEGSYPITQGYGDKGTSAFHTGIDYALPANTPVLASESGTVVFSGWDNTGYGNCVIILHPDGDATLYAHLNKVMAFKGNCVQKSQIIGYSGSTGNSTGPHLHFEARHTWNNYKDHFDPNTLPLHTSIENVVLPPPPSHIVPLKGAEKFHADEVLQVKNDFGAKAFYSDAFTDYTVYPKGTKFYYTGKSVIRKSNGLTYLEVVSVIRTLYVAVNDGDVQILDTP